MTNLEELYNAIKKLKELGTKLPDELLDEVDRVEQKIISDEVIPLLTDAIEPILSQIQRNLVLVVEYIPDEPLLVKMSRKRSFNTENDGYEEVEDNAVPKKEVVKKSGYTQAPHTKSKRTNILVTFPDGVKIQNRYAFQTLMATIERIGINRAEKLGIKQNGIYLLSRTKDDFYQQHKLGELFLLTQTSTKDKKKVIQKISDRLNLNLKVEIVKV